MTEDDLIIYPVGLSGGRYAKLYLPRDLTKMEAEKIGRIVASLAVEIQQSAVVTSVT
jgi:hypothetical protein